MKYLTIFLFFCFSALLFSQDSTQIDSTKSQTVAPVKENKIETQKPQLSMSEWIAIAGVLVGLSGFLFGIYKHLSKKKIEIEIQRAKREDELEYTEQSNNLNARTAEQILKDTLTTELGSIRLLGSPDIQNLPVKLLESFVNLRISESWRTEEQFQHPNRVPTEGPMDRDFDPVAIMKRAFKHKRMLVIIGDPGSGKTTLLKYYAMTCLEGNAQILGLPGKIIVLYLPLRKLNISQKLCTNFADWADDHEAKIDEDVFYRWLHEEKTLILLDGLDEISNVEDRKKACEWIDKKAAGLKNARFVVTSRWTGYSKLDGIELGFDHVRADIKEFNWNQQQEFLKKWFNAVASVEQPPQDAATDWRETQLRNAEKRARELIEYLGKKENAAVRKLADSPLLLQIIAILGRERAFHANDRTELFRSALNYLLDFRDRKRNLNPFLPAKQAKRVLAPTSLWMQQEIGRDDVSREKMHKKMRPLIKTMKEDLTSEEFCNNLCERAGILAKLGDTDYIFRHKSFREYLAGLQIVKNAGDTEFLKNIVNKFGDPWWEEPLRFFMGEADADIFDNFMDALFSSDATKELRQEAQTLLELLMNDAPEKKTDRLAERLLDEGTGDNQKRYILNCLKTIGTEQARNQIRQYANSEDRAAGFARELVAGFEEQKIKTVRMEPDIFKSLPNSFRSPVEEAAEYILIPGGSYTFTVTEKKVTVPNTYFAKYPVTNKRYNRFIAYLKGEANELNDLLLLNSFIEQLLEFSKIEEGSKKYMGDDPKGWPEELASKEDSKKFLGDDQPVVGVTWYGAMAYCLWLTLLGTASQKNKKNVTLNEATAYYRLPHEREWEWAAFGEQDGSLREFPWPKDKGDPTPKLANYEKNVGATTPVGRYPEGATPQGLMDMAGNVWEWQSNLYKKDKNWRSLRGGSWSSNVSYLRRPSRSVISPDYDWFFSGFRVVFSESSVLETLEL